MVIWAYVCTRVCKTDFTKLKQYIVHKIDILCNTYVRFVVSLGLRHEKQQSNVFEL